MQSISVYTDVAVRWASTLGLKLLSAAVVFIIGLYVINWIGRSAKQSFIKSKVDQSLQSFFSSLLMAGLRVLLLITVAGMLGIETTSFVAIIGALGLAVGLALQGSLSNFAGGVLILVFKPFKVGDIIESQGQTGAVIEIQIFNTILLTPDNRTIILANGAVSNGTIVNFSRHGDIRVDISLEIEALNNINDVRNVATKVCLSHPLVLATPAPAINVAKIGEGKIAINICPYTTAKNYWTVFFEVQELIKIAFDEHKVIMPEPHLFITNIQREPAY